MPVYSIDGLVPVVHPEAFVHPTASLIGDVIIDSGCYIGPGVSLRGDFGRIVIGQGANVQDNCVLHTLPGADVIVEVDGHIGHGAVLHGCTLGRNALVGINAIIMDNAEIGESSIIGAGAFLKTGFVCPPRSLVVGNPAKVKRSLTDNEVAWKSQATGQYQKLVSRCLDSFTETQPLKEIEKNRPRLEAGEFYSLKQSRK
jgi:phenylacetic acid degradation protein